MSIFFNFPESMKDYPLYLSLNQPKVEKFFRVIPTKFVASCCNPLVTVDKEFMTIISDLAHDIFAHKQLIKSRVYTVFPSVEKYAQTFCSWIVKNHPDCIEELFNLAHENSLTIGTKNFARAVINHPVLNKYPIYYISNESLQEQDIEL